MKLYWAPRTRSLTSVWLMEEAGMPYERVLVDTLGGEQDTPAYRAINSMGKVPALVDGDTHVSETGAICTYVADRFPEAGLAPRPDDPTRGDYLRWMFFAGSCIEPAYMQKFSNWETVKSRAAWGDYETVVKALEDGLTEGPWITGERFTAADVVIGSAVFFGLAFGLLDKNPVFSGYAERCEARPALQRARKIEADAVAAMEASKSGS